MTRLKQGDRLSTSRALSRLLPLFLCLLGTLLLASPDCFAKPKAAPPSKKPSPGDILAQAQALEARKQYEEAVAAYREYLVVKPADDKARTVLADILFRQGKLDEAAAEYEAMLAQYPDRLTLSLALAGVKVKQKKFQDAQTLYKNVLSTDPNSLAARRGLADTLYLSGQHALALPHYETFNAATKDAAVAELIKNVKAELLERARALDAAQRYKEAAAAYREYLAARPDDDDARGAWARTLALQGLLPQAVALYQEILARHPSDIGVLVGIGKIFIWQKNPGSARSYYEEALRIDPGNLEARRGMADVLYWSGKDKDALRAYEAIFSSTQDPEAGQRVRELRGEQLGSPRAPFGKPQLLPTLPFRDYIKAGYSPTPIHKGLPTSAIICWRQARLSATTPWSGGWNVCTDSALRTSRSQPNSTVRSGTRPGAA